MGTRGYIEHVYCTYMPHNYSAPSLFTIRKLSSTQVSYILFLLDSGKSATSIHRKTGYSATTISCIRSEHCPNLSKPLRGCPHLLSTSNISYAKRVIHTGKVDNAAEAAILLRTNCHKGFCTQTLHRGLKQSGMVAVVKKKP